jgi:CMP-N,N'-diacetyllegionaminic acid synthase
VAIIPARGGSKGLPGKNILPICGKPLIGWSIEQALRSTYIDTVVVSTDSAEIAEVAKYHGAEVPFLRPPEIATDTSTTFEAVVHALAHYESKLAKSFSYVLLLEPTAPLRETSDVDQMLEKLDRLAEDFDAVISIGEMTLHPLLSKSCQDNRLVSTFGRPESGSRRQDLREIFWPFGGLYAIKTGILLSCQTFYPERLTFHKLKRYQCYEIDDFYDFLCVEAVMKYEWALK